MKKLTTILCLTVALLFGCTGVCKSADFQRGLTAHKSGDYAIALREWKPLAKQGDAAAQFNLGVMYEKGQGVPQDDKTAVKWYRLAAEQGFARAQSSPVWVRCTGMDKGSYRILFMPICGEILLPLTGMRMVPKCEKSLRRI